MSTITLKAVPRPCRCWTAEDFQKAGEISDRNLRILAGQADLEPGIDGHSEEPVQCDSSAHNASTFPQVKALAVVEDLDDDEPCLDSSNVVEHICPKCGRVNRRTARQL